MKATAMVTAALLSSASFAQYEQFPDVPENHWVYVTLTKLAQENVILSYKPKFGSGRPMDRMELAIWTLHACSAMLSDLENAEFAYRSGEYPMDSARAQASALGKLAKETDNLAKMAFLFEPELKKRHIDAMALRRDMLSFPKRIERIASPTQRPSAYELPTQDSALLEQFPDIPENHWVYQTLLNLRESDIIEVPDGFFRGSRPASTFEVAYVAFEACVVLRHRFAGLQGAALKQMKLLHDDIANLAKMADSFAPQYKWMLVDHVSLKKEMEAISKYIEQARRNDGGG